MTYIDYVLTMCGIETGGLELSLIRLKNRPLKQLTNPIWNPILRMGQLGWKRL